MLFHPESGRFFVLNQTMAFIWGRCDADCSLDALRVGLAESFEGVEHETAEEDLRRALSELAELGLIEEIEGDDVARTTVQETRG